MSEHPRLFARTGDTYVLGVMRLGLGVLLAIQSAQRLLELGRVPYFGDVFHMPILPEALVPSASLYAGLELLSLVLATLVVLGVQARPSLLFASSLGIYLILCNRLDYHNNRFALFLVGLLLAFAPCDRSLVLVRGRAHTRALAERAGPLWAVLLIRLQISAVYLSSGGGKLLDPDWRGGQTMLVRFTRSLEYLAAQGRPAPALVARLYSSPDFASLASKAAIATELFLAVALWLPRLRAPALYLGVLFHLGIELSARVELFSYLMGVAYVAFVVPKTGERVIEVDPESRLGRVVLGVAPFVDWLRRFRWVPSAFGPFRSVDRDGSVRMGLSALALAARGIPLLFPLWLPLALAGRLTRGLTRSGPAGRPKAG